MVFWKTRQQRIGVYTRDERQLDNANIRLDNLEDLLRSFLKKPYHIDEYAFEKLIRLHAEAACTQAVAASGKSTILGALRAIAAEKSAEMQSASLWADSPAKVIRMLMCQAMLGYIKHEIMEWEKITPQ